MSSTSEIPLGGFTLREKIGAGAMGQVWRGFHTHSGRPVAVKMLTSAFARRPEFQGRFEREVEATSRLSHPNVVRVLDYGVVPHETNGLIEGSPYFVMELADTVVNRSGVLDWEAAHIILESLLRGLAHSHAHDVIHRDIKPGNILQFKNGRIALADFGISHELERNKPTDVSQTTGKSEEEASGTPRYMSPEQIMGKWRDYGPWTDIYSVGILAYQLITGSAPFQGDNLYEVAMNHLGKDIPKLQAQFEVPPEVDAWIRRLASKSANDRPQSANAALRELREFSKVQTPTPKQDPVPYGVGLFGVRRIPAIGRRQEMRKLMTLARKTRETHGVQVAIIRGPHGVGCTTLANWLRAETSELGVLRTFKIDASLDALSWAITQRYRTAGLSLEKCEARLKDLLTDVSPEEVSGLAALASQASTPAADRQAAGLSLAEAQELVRRAIWRDAHETPTLVVLDNPETATLGVLQKCLQAEAAPVMFVVTGNLPSDWGFFDDPRVNLVDLNVLDSDSMSHLVRDQIGIPAPIARKIETLAKGLPIAAIQLVEHWRQEGNLVVDSRGVVELKDARVPTEVADIYHAKASDFLARIMPKSNRQSALLALEMAAALGESWPIDEFEVVLTETKTVLPGWQNAMVRSGIIRLTDKRAEFTHPLIRASIIDGSLKHDSWPLVNANVSKTLATHYPATTHGLAGRLAKHLLAANQASAATFALSEALERARERIAAAEFGELGELLETALEKLKVPATDIRWGVAWAHRAVPLATSARPDDREEAARLLGAAVDVANQVGKQGNSAATIKGIAGWATTHLGAGEDGLKLIEETLETHVRGAARLFNLVFLTSLYSHHRRFEEMEDVANEVLRTTTIPAWKLRVREALIHKALVDHDLVVAQAHIEASLELANSTGQPRMRGHLHNLMGFAADAAGDFSLAETEHRAALAIFDVYGEGSSYRLSTAEYVIRALVQQGRFAEAKQDLELLSARIKAGATGFKFHPVDVELACAAGLQNWGRVKELWEEATRFDSVRPNTLHARALLSAAKSWSESKPNEAQAFLRCLRTLFEKHAELSHFLPDLPKPHAH